MNWTTSPCAALNANAQHEAEAHQAQLTKPTGSLGRLEHIAIQLAAMQSTAKPHIKKPYIAVFAGDHGIAIEGVSAFPQVVTGEMIRNFARGGAAISVLAKAQDATLSVINCGTAYPIESLEGVLDFSIAAGTANFLQSAAMTAEQCAIALSIGKKAVETALEQGADIFIAGEMGIANTTSASAIACALLDRTAADLAGNGTGIDAATLDHKVKVIAQALRRHNTELTSPLAILQHLGGFEIAAITGAYLACAKEGLPIIVDGFISSVAALLAVKHHQEVQQWMFFSHASAEQGHSIIMQALNAHPILDLEMRLGEGSGAATALAIIKLACELHNNMATFTEASVSGAGI